METSIHSEASESSALDGALPAVLQAVREARISKAHAQLLAVLRPETQAGAIEELLNMPLLPGVGELKTGIESMAIPLASAAFPKGDCLTCSYNTDNLQSGDSVSLRPGLCINSACSADKHAQHVAATVSALKMEHRAVQPPADGSFHREIEETGENAVGTEQASKCRTECSFFGAAVMSAGPGFPIKVVTQVCTNVQCNAHMVTAQRTREVAGFRERIWKRALAAHVRQFDAVASRRALLLFMTLGWSCGGSAAAALIGTEKTPTLEELEAFAVGLEPKGIAEALTQATVLAIDNAPVHQVQTMLRHFKVRLEDFWVMPAAFLEKLSFEEIEDIIKDLRIAVTPSMDSARASGSRLALAQAVAKVITRADVQGYIPHCLRY